MIATTEAVELREMLRALCRKLDAMIEKDTMPDRGLGMVTSQAFERFFAAYPRQLKKSSAFRAWEALSPSKELVIEIMGALAQHKVSWVGKDLGFIPYAENWLIERRWLDKLDSVVVAAEKPKLCPRCRVGGADFRPVVLSKDQKTVICRRCRDEEDI